MTYIVPDPWKVVHPNSYRKLYNDDPTFDSRRKEQRVHQPLFPEGKIITISWQITGKLTFLIPHKLLYQAFSQQTRTMNGSFHGCDYLEKDRDAQYC